MSNEKAKARYKYLQLKKRKIELESKMKKDAQESVAAKDVENTQFIKETLVDAPVKLAEGATMGFLDELAGLGAVTQRMKVEEAGIEDVYDEPYEQTYEGTRDIVRGAERTASERSPVISAAASMAGGAMTAQTGNIWQVLKTGGSMGAGYSEEETASGVLQDMALGAGIAGITHGVTETVKIPFTDTDRTRALNLGASRMDFDKTGALGDPRVMARNLNKVDFFSGGKTALNTDKMRFVRPKGMKGEPVRSEGILPARVDLERKAKSALGKIKVSKSEILRKSKVPVSVDSLLDRIKKSMSQLMENSTDQNSFSKSVHKHAKTLIDDVMDDPSLIRLEKIKQNWQNQAQDTLESSVLNPVFKADAQIQARLSSVLKEEIEASVHGISPRLGEKFIKLNELGSSLHQAKRGLRKMISAKDAGGSGIETAFNPYASPLLQGAKASEFLASGEKGTLMRANIGDVMSKVPEKAVGQMKVAPIRAAVGREPQSIAEEVVRWKIPRTTEGVIENKDMVLAKVAQMEPMQFDNIKEVLEEQPEKLPDLIPILAQTAPHLFEEDKYGRVDNVIYDPAKKQMAREDLNLNESLSNSQRMLMMNQLNKTGEFEL